MKQKKSLIKIQIRNTFRMSYTFLLTSFKNKFLYWQNFQKLQNFLKIIFNEIIDTNGLSNFFYRRFLIKI